MAIFTSSHVAPDPEPGSVSPLRRATDRAAYGPIEDQAQMMAIGAAFDHVVDTRAERLTLAVVVRICKVYDAHMRMYGGKL